VPPYYLCTMVLVTGGTGFIGSYILYYLLKGHDKLRAIYRKRKVGSWKREENTGFVFHHLLRIEENLSQKEAAEKIKDLLNRIEWLEADVLDSEALKEAADGVEQIFHSAA